VAALRKKMLLDTQPSDTLDNITSTMAEVFRVKVVLVTLVDKRRIWYKSRHNYQVKQAGRKESLCAWALMSPKVLLVNNMTNDARFRSHPLVTEAGVRFYAACPLVVDGYIFGTLCVMDYEPKENFDAEKVRLLKMFGDMVSKELARPAHQHWMVEGGDWGR
jgi:GAF domain-containing protein